MKKVGILGGTFDPPHIGHLEIARAVLLQFGLCEVRLMTGGMPPHKRDKKVTPAKLRYEMTKIALAEEKGIIADDYEVLKTDYSYTAKTLTELKKIHPDWEIYFIIGEDSLCDLHLWYEPQTVINNCILLVYPRNKNSDINRLIEQRKAEFGADIRLINAPIVDVSSTVIRERIKNNKPVDGLVCENVLEFIKENGIYT